MEWSIDFIYKWQELIGAALGPFLAIVLSAIGFLIKSKLDQRAERKEFLRRIEVEITSTLNDVYNAREQLKYFVGMVKKLVSEVKAVTNPKQFSLERINFPALLEIHCNPDIRDFKVRSYYLHNKILFSDSAVKGINKILASLEVDFKELLKQNEFLIALMQNNPNPPIQRQAYIENLEIFASAVEDYATKKLQKPIKMLTQVKIYNDYLRKPYGRGYWIWWKMERTKFKFFRTKAEQKKYARNLDSLDRIDAKIEDEVQKALLETEKRADTILQ